MLSVNISGSYAQLGPLYRPAYLYGPTLLSHSIILCDRCVGSRSRQAWSTELYVDLRLRYPAGPWWQQDAAEQLSPTSSSNTDLRRGGAVGITEGYAVHGSQADR